MNEENIQQLLMNEENLQFFPNQKKKKFELCKVYVRNH